MIPSSINPNYRFCCKAKSLWQNAKIHSQKAIILSTLFILDLGEYRRIFKWIMFAGIHKWKMKILWQNIASYTNNPTTIPYIHMYTGTYLHNHNKEKHFYFNFRLKFTVWQSIFKQKFKTKFLTTTKKFFLFFKCLWAFKCTMSTRCNVAFR